MRLRGTSGEINLARVLVDAGELTAADEVTEISTRLLGELVTNAPPKDREVEVAKAKARAAQRYAA